jgi:hypothetical protein
MQCWKRWIVGFMAIGALVLAGCGGGNAPTGTDRPPATAIPTGVSASPGDGEVTIAWMPVTGATSYNIYGSITAGVTTTGTKITGATSPYTQTGLTNGTPYYYVVTSVNGNGESAVSSQVTATPFVPTFDVSKYTTLVTGATLGFSLVGTDMKGIEYSGTTRYTVIGPATLDGLNVIEKDVATSITEAGVGVVLSTTTKYYYKLDKTLYKIIYSNGETATAVDAWSLPSTEQIGFFYEQFLPLSNGNWLEMSWELNDAGNGNANLVIGSSNSYTSTGGFESTTWWFGTETDTLEITPTGDIPVITLVLFGVPATAGPVTLQGTEL